MKKILLILITLLLTLTLFSCGDDATVPEGMQLVDGSEEEGYIFYAPEGWTNGVKMNGVSYAYVSRSNTTSISFTEIDKSSFVKPDPSVNDEEFFFNGYFASLESEFPESTVWGDKGTPVLLGSGDTKADKAVKYTYNYLYEVQEGYNKVDRRIAFTQILASNNGRFYILTYSAPVEHQANKDNYDYYLEKFYMVVDNFKFYDSEKKPAENKEYPTDSDGDILASDKKLAGFELYVPSDFSVDYSSAIISATHADGSNITMTKATDTGTTINNYWLLRKERLSLYVDSITDIGTNPTAMEFSNASNAAVCEYTYVYGGKTFHVYQIFSVSGGLIKNGYIFTYTALEDNYSSHIADINRILAKVKF